MPGEKGSWGWSGLTVVTGYQFMEDLAIGGCRDAPDEPQSLVEHRWL